MEYTQENLIDLAYIRLKEIEKNKLSISKPDVKFLNCKTYFKNFYEICKSFNRENDENNHFKNFINKELEMKITVDEKKNLLIHGRKDQKQISKLVSDYYNRFIKCKTCSNGVTTYLKIKKIHANKCLSCNQINNLDNYNLYL